MVNLLPNGDNYPVPSFQRPVQSPDIDPDAGDLVSASFNAAWIPVIEGALDQLTLPATWLGTDDEIKLALNRVGTLKDIFASAEVPISAPYWDDENGDDLSGDPAEGEGAPWYGILLGESTWQEQIEDWLIAGFLAWAGAPGAAVQFLTVAPKFRLFFKTLDIGGIVKIFVDASEYGTVDTYSATPGIASMDIVIPPSMGFAAEDVDTHTLWVEVTGDHNADATPDENGQYPVFIVRKRLYEAELASPSVAPAFQTRYSPSTGIYQVSTDGGSTWTDAPQADPRNITYAPPVTGDNASCDVAYRVTQVLKQLEEALVAQLNAEVTDATVAAGFVGILTPFIPGLAIAIAVIILAIDAMAALGVSIIEAAFDDTVWRNIECQIYLTLSGAAQVDATLFADVQTAITDHVGGTAAQVVNYLLSIMGYGGFNNVAGASAGTDDCSDCGVVCLTPAGQTGMGEPGCSGDLGFHYDGLGATSSTNNGVTFSAIFFHPASFIAAGANGWKVTISWTTGMTPGGSFGYGTNLDSGASDCVDGFVALTKTSGLQQDVPTSHPYIILGWLADGDVFHVEQICVEQWS